jgi:hypothetical protein
MCLGRIDMETYAVAKKIEALCDSVGKKCENIAKFVASDKLPSALAEYDKAIEMAIAQLQANGEPATLTKDKAKGMCKDQLFILKSLEIKWKAMLTILEATKAQLNGYQSVNRHLSEA